MEDAFATAVPSSSVISASTKATLLPPEITVATQVRVVPTRAGLRKDTLISTLAENTFSPRRWAKETDDAPMAESAMAARKPP